MGYVGSSSCMVPTRVWRPRAMSESRGTFWSPGAVRCRAGTKLPPGLIGTEVSEVIPQFRGTEIFRRACAWLIGALRKAVANAINLLRIHRVVWVGAKGVTGVVTELEPRFNAATTPKLPPVLRERDLLARKRRLLNLMRAPSGTPDDRQKLIPPLDQDFGLCAPR